VRRAAFPALPSVAFCPVVAATFLDARACAVRDVFRWALAHAGARKDAQALRVRQDAVFLVPVAADEWAGRDAGRFVRAKCRAVARDCLLATGHDFQKAEAARLAAAGHLVALVRRDAREQFPAPQPLVASQMAVWPVSLLEAACSREPQLQAELVRLQVVQPEPPDEWVSVQQAQPVSRRLERQRVPA